MGLGWPWTAIVPIVGVPAIAARLKCLTVQPVTNCTPCPRSQVTRGVTSESDWLNAVRLTPANVSIRETSSMKRCRYRLNATALCQGWKAKAVTHMYQNSVSKNSGGSQSVMQSVPSSSSLAWLSFNSSSRSLIEKLIETTGTLARRRSTSRAGECAL